MAKKTLLWSVHQKTAQMSEFAGWDMPIRYSDIQAEHRAVRTAAGLFDVSHMGELRLKGPEAMAFADYLVTNKLAPPEKMRAIYSPMCYENGGTVDDLFIYVLSPDDVLFVVNAGNIDKDEAHIRSILPQTLTLTNESEEWMQLALQGPAAKDILSELYPISDMLPAEMKFMTWKPFQINKYAGILSRSGYTGGDGYEVYVRCKGDATFAADLWQQFLTVGAPYGLVPVGLGARDTLRLEGALPLYGHELRDDVSPIEANLLRFVHVEKGGFVGQNVLKKQLKEGTEHVLAGLSLVDRGIMREGCSVFDASHEAIGQTTSGGVAVMAGGSIAMALIKRNKAVIGEPVWVEVRGRMLKAEAVSIPFFHKPSQT